MEKFKLVVHDRLEKPFISRFGTANCFGYYDPATMEAHVLSVNVLHRLVVEHEKLHWERRHSITAFIPDKIIKFKKWFIGICVVFAVVFFLTRYVEATPTWVSPILAVLLLVFWSSNMLDEFLVDRASVKRVREKLG